jgi:curli production assembly/transport component CsgG
MQVVSEFDMTVRPFLRHGFMLLGVIALAACTSVPPSNVKANAKLTPNTRITRELTQLPEPRAKVPVAVYSLRDQTGQYKNSPDSPYSTQVTQGAATMLINALRNSGWYMPVEREGLQNLLTERRIVRAIESPSDKGKPVINLPNLMPASLIIEGGIIAYESNVRTGGKGANYLGIGASTQYRVDQVTASLRSIDIRSGQVLNTVSVTKTIYSYQFSANVYAYVAYQKLLQGETGFTTNEPAQLAVREALESAVIHLTVQSVHDRILELKNERDWSSPIIQSYLREGVTNISNEELDEDEIIPMLPMNADLQSQMVVPLVVETPKPEPVRLPEPVAALVEPPVAPAPQSKSAIEPEVKPLAPVKKASDDIFKSYWGDKPVKSAVPVKPVAQPVSPVVPVKPVVTPPAPSAIVTPPVVPSPAVQQSALQSQPVPQPVAKATDEVRLQAQAKADKLKAEQDAKDASDRLKTEQQAKATRDAQDKKVALVKAKQDARDAKAAQLKADKEAKADAERVKAEQTAKAAADAKAANEAKAQAVAEEKAAKAKAQQEAKVAADRLKAEQEVEAARLKQEQVARTEAAAQEKKAALAKARQDARDAKAAQLKSDQAAKAEAERVKAEQVAAEAQARNAARLSGQSAAQQFDAPVLVQPSAANPSALASEALPEDPASPRATETRNFLKSSLSGKKRVKQAKALKSSAATSTPATSLETPVENSAVESVAESATESQVKSNASTKGKSAGDIFRTYWELN